MNRDGVLIEGNVLTATLGDLCEQRIRIFGSTYTTIVSVTNVVDVIQALIKLGKPERVVALMVTSDTLDVDFKRIATADTRLTLPQLLTFVTSILSSMLRKPCDDVFDVESQRHFHVDDKMMQRLMYLATIHLGIA